MATLRRLFTSSAEALHEALTRLCTKLCTKLCTRVGENQYRLD